MTPTPPRVDRERGTRMRAGNAMSRTQTAIVAAVGRCVAAHGARRTTMIDVAAAAGIAKGTLYNHVRTKSEAYGLYAEAEVGRLLDLLAGRGSGGAAPASPDVADADDAGGPVAAALVAAADALADHPVVRRLRADEPAALAAALAGPAALALRPQVLEALEDLLGPQRSGVAYRWLLSLLVQPGDGAERRVEARAIAG